MVDSDRRRDSKAGLMTSLYIQCDKCKNMIHIPISKKPTPRGMSYELNGSVYTAVLLGHKGLSLFCAFFNVPPPVHHDSYQMHLKQISEASVAHAEENMKSAVSCPKSTLKDSGHVSDDYDGRDVYARVCINEELNVGIPISYTGRLLSLGV